MMRLVFCCTAVALILVLGRGSEGADPMEDKTPVFAPGQVWTYKTRPSEQPSRIVVCRIESDTKVGEIVHIYVDGLHIKNKRAESGYSDHIGHMPYSSEALGKSVIKLESIRKELPSFEDGYQQWRSAFDQGNAGVWTAPVSEAITGMEKAMNQ